MCFVARTPQGVHGVRYVPEVLVTSLGGRTSKTHYVPRRSGEKPKKALKYSLRPGLVREDWGT